MPDFEALIRHQQLKQPSDDQRLKIVKPLDSSEETNHNELNSEKSKIIYYFFASFGSSLVGTLIILFLYANDYITLDILEINKFIQSLI